MEDRVPNPTLLVEKILRSRIYDSVYWKESCFALNAATLLDRVVELDCIGGHYGVQRPTPFICLLLKMLHLRPEPEIIELFLQDKEFKYLNALAALYLRLTGSVIDIYSKLEPFLEDRRKLRRRNDDGSFSLTFMDEFVDELLMADRSCSTILPRIPKRHVLEDNGEIEPRYSILEEELEGEDDEGNMDKEDDTFAVEDGEVPEEGNEDDHIPIKRAKLQFKESGKQEKPVLETRKSAAAPKTDSGDSLSIEESNRIRASLGLPPLK